MFCIWGVLGNDRMVMFSANGKFLFTWGVRGPGNGSFMDPRGVATTANEIFVVDTGFFLNPFPP